MHQHNGGSCPSSSAQAGRRARLTFALLNSDLYCLGRFALRLRDMYRQNSVLAFRTNAPCIGVVWQRKTAGEHAAKTLPPVNSLALLFFVELSLASDGDCIVVNRDTDVLFLHSRQVGANEILAVRLTHIKHRRPSGFPLVRFCRQTWPPAHEAAKRSGKKLIHLTNRIPAYKIHNNIPSSNCSGLLTAKQISMAPICRRY